jgi:Erv1 / Alr family
MQHMKKSLTRVAVTGLISAWNLSSCTPNSVPNAAVVPIPSTAAVSDAHRPGRSTTGVNPFDCINPACSSKMDLLKNAMKKQKKATAVAPVIEKPIDTESTAKVAVGDFDSIPSDLPVLASTEAVNQVTDKISAVILPESGCPLDKEELGRSTWDLIHTIAAYYPDSPSDADKEKARNFISSVSYLYPCEVCREDFKQSVADFPPQ